MIISIPNYIRQFIRPDLDVFEENKLCCLFHTENTPSMVYSAEKEIITCFGACHKTWRSAEELHMTYYNLGSIETARADLCRLLGLSYEEKTELQADRAIELDQELIDNMRLVELAKNRMSYKDFAQALTYYPIDFTRLEN